jgi:diguanylate cyclase (GGDEF)-like protein
MKPRILVVEDDKATLKVLERLLEHLGELTLVETGKAALEYIQNELPDLILLDIGLPDIDGLQVCSAIKAKFECRDIPILFLTAATETSIEEKALELGAVDFITKPVRPGIVKARVQTHLKLKLKSDELLKKSLVDPLTGLANRRALKEVLDMEWWRSLRSGTPICFLMIDIDYFKEYNDRFGHLAGDRALYEVAYIIQQTFKRANDITARYGGEEFAVVLPDTPPEAGRLMAEKLLQLVLAKGIEHPTSKVSSVITVSVGLAYLVMPTNETHEKWRPDDLATTADSALYLAKSSGRNQLQMAALDS